MRKRLNIVAVVIIIVMSVVSLSPIVGHNSTPVFADDNSESGESDGSESGGSGSGQIDCGNGELPEEVKDAAGCNKNEDRLAIVITNILISIIFFSGSVSVVYIVIGGIKYISSQGNADMVQQGRKTILYATIGLVISSLAFAIVNFAINAIYNKPTETENNQTDSESETSISSDDVPSYTPADIWKYHGSSGVSQGDEVSSIRLLSYKRIYVGDKERMIPHITPSSLMDKTTIKWTSGNPSIVSVDDEGYITPKRSGTATITATTENGKSASSEITVVEPVEAESVTLEPSVVKNLVSGKLYNLKATVEPRNTANKHLTWSTDNALVATVNSRGQVLGKKAGKANITARTENGKLATIPVTVVDADGGTIKITPSLLSELEYYYQTNRHEPVPALCGSTAGAITCGPATYMASVYALTKRKIDYPEFVKEGCGRWIIAPYGAGVAGLSTVYANEYESKYGVKVRRIPLTWEAAVAELKKGHTVIFNVEKPSDSIINSQGYRFTDGRHYVVALSYRNQGGGQMYIWNPVPYTADPRRNIGDCSKGECWYDRAAFERNINLDALSVEKIKH